MFILNYIRHSGLDLGLFTNYITVTVIALILLFAIKFFWESFQGYGRKKKPKSVLDELNSIKQIQEIKKIYEGIRNLNEDATDQDMIPGGTGEFGYEKTNPIPVNTIIGNTVYLDRLRTPDGTKVRYERLGSTHAENINCPVDIYNIFDGEIKIATLYISPYNKKNSSLAPKGFKLETLT